MLRWNAALIGAITFFLISYPAAIADSDGDWFLSLDESWDHPYSIVIDEDSNRYVFGYFSGIKDFDPGPRRAILTTDRDDASYFVKFSPSGKFRWVTAWCNDAVGPIRSAAFDAKSNIYLVGNFTETVDFDPGRREFIRTSKGGPDSYLIKLNRKGDFEWACTWGDDGWDEASGVSVDDDGNIYVICTIWSTFDFYSSTGEVRGIAKGGGKSCLLKIDADGNFRDVYRWDACEPKDVATDSEGGVYIAGDFGLGSAPDFGLGMVDFAPGPAIEERMPMTSFNGYLLKLTSDGEFEWVQTWAVPGVFYVFGVAFDKAGGVYIVGELPDWTLIDPDFPDEIFATEEPYDIYVIKLDIDGAVQWGHTWSADDWLTAERIYADNDGFIYVIGDYSTPVDFDPGSGIAFPPGEGEGAFLIRMDTDGIFHNLYTWPGRLDGFPRG
jgi:hypothetical protein